MQVALDQVKGQCRPRFEEGQVTLFRLGLPRPALWPGAVGHERENRRKFIQVPLDRALRDLVAGIVHALQRRGRISPARMARDMARHGHNAGGVADIGRRPGLMFYTEDVAQASYIWRELHIINHN